MPAYACRISEENLQVIASENPKFDMEEIVDWLNAHESGYFLRDEGSPFDCQYLADVVFNEIYAFERGGESELFRRVTRL